jgi:hypothetical protein
MLDDPFIDVLSAAVDALDRCGIPYAITGSVASGLHGEPIASQDVDIVIRMTPAQARRLASELPDRFYRSAESLIEIADRGGISHLIDTRTALKIDLSVPAATGFFDSVFDRRSASPLGVDAPAYQVVSAEDVILMKLIWRKDTRSAKQWENALGVARVKGARMDWKYLFEQARALGIEDDLMKLRDEAGI